MKWVCSVLLAAGLSACSFAPITVTVPDLTLPGNDSLGLICYEEVSQPAPANFRRATYSGAAIYTSSVPGNEIMVRVYGRTTPPANPCVNPSDEDIPLSSSFPLRAGESRAVEIGGAGYETVFADLIVNEPYWLGAAVAGGVLFSTEERITLTDGVIRVSY